MRTKKIIIRYFDHVTKTMSKMLRETGKQSNNETEMQIIAVKS